MKYQLSRIRPTQLPELGKVEIKNQAGLKAKFGESLDLVKAYNLVKQMSKDFTVADELALKVDEAMSKLLVKRSFWEEGSTPMPVKEAQPKANPLEMKIKGFKVALQFSEGEQKQAIIKKIKAFEVAKKFTTKAA